ncbi:MAG: hypothetical protein LBQ54_07540 [Planctomycetaceae bacterium]|jgi:hypothetical protein|nr:hypothetical protein [Planctomycetaceae bacterium]
MYAYFDGTKWITNLSADRIKQLALSGVIKPDTLVRSPSGSEMEAGNIKSLKFEESVPALKQKTEKQTKPFRYNKSSAESFIELYLAVCFFASCAALVVGLANQSPIGVAGIGGILGTASQYFFYALIQSIRRDTQEIKFIIKSTMEDHSNET